MSQRKRPAINNRTPSPALRALGITPIEDNSTHEAMPIPTANNTSTTLSEPPYPPKAKQLTTPKNDYSEIEDARSERAFIQFQLPLTTYHKLAKAVFELKQQGDPVPMWELVCAQLDTTLSSPDEAFELVRAWRGKVSKQQRRKMTVSGTVQVKRRVERIAFDLTISQGHKVLFWELCAAALDKLADKPDEALKLVERWRYQAS